MICREWWIPALSSAPELACGGSRRTGVCPELLERSAGGAIPVFPLVPAVGPASVGAIVEALNSPACRQSGCLELKSGLSVAPGDLC